MLVNTWSKVLIGAAMVAAPLAFGGDPEAIYVVPADADLGLDQDAQMIMDRARLEEVGSELILDYRLPRELDGQNAQRFRLKGPNVSGTVALTTADGGVTATCDNSAAELSCVMRYLDGIQLDDKAAETFIQRTVTDQNRLAELRAARGVLEHQAVGIIRFIRD